MKTFSMTIVVVAAMVTMLAMAAPAMAWQPPEGWQSQNPQIQAGVKAVDMSLAADELQVVPGDEQGIPDDNDEIPGEDAGIDDGIDEEIVPGDTPGDTPGLTPSDETPGTSVTTPVPPTATSTRLPKTGTNLALLAGIGLIVAAGAFSARLVHSRRSR